MSENIIEVNSLTKTYKMYNKPIDRLKESISPTRKVYGEDFHALKGISFTVANGENIGIVGTNGSGKSTLLKIITGVLTKSQGELEVNGKIAALLELGTGFNQEYTGIENIYLNGTMMGFTTEQMDAKVDGIVEFAGIGEFIYQPVKTYSSGMFARLAFAVAINVEPDILIVDEALSVGDTRFQLKCMKRMKGMMAGGTTVLFVSHDINAIKRFCSRAIWLNHGNIIADGDANKVTDQYLDFLKVSELDGVEETTLEEECKQTAQIMEVILKNHDGKELDEVKLDEELCLEIIYEVYDAKRTGSILRVAMYSIDGDYTCGFNTRWDYVELPWKWGENRIRLVYPFGVRAIGGSYYVDVAIMDESERNEFCNKHKAKEFTLVAEYIGEGRLIIPHEWM